MLTALDFAHVRPLDRSQVRQCFLRDALPQSDRPHGLPECGGQNGVCRFRPQWTTSLDDARLHGQEGPGRCTIKPRYV